jgi:CheY-like chemotaxis protein
MDLSVERTRVLVAEDDEEMRKLLAWSMSRKGYEVTECRDGTELMRKLGLFDGQGGGSAFDVVVSDIRMPGATGLEALEAVRELEELPPVIFITAFADQDAYEQADRLGAAGVLAKPFDTDELLRRMDELAPAPAGIPGSRRGMWVRREPPFPVDVTFRHGPSSEPVSSFVREMAGKLSVFGDRILRCRVVLEGWAPEPSHARRRHVRLRIQTDTGFVVANDGHAHGDRENIYLAIRVAFANASRRLKRRYRKNGRPHAIAAIRRNGHGDTGESAE